MPIAFSLGAAIGAGMGVMLFVVTGNPFWLGMAGVGVGCGLAIGAALEAGKQVKGGGLPPKDG